MKRNFTGPPFSRISDLPSQGRIRKDLTSVVVVELGILGPRFPFPGEVRKWVSTGGLGVCGRGGSTAFTTSSVSSTDVTTATQSHSCSRRGGGRSRGRGPTSGTPPLPPSTIPKGVGSGREQGTGTRGGGWNW